MGEASPARARRRLRVLQLLGTGGFGRVYRVRDLHLEREVALKVLHPSLTQDPKSSSASGARPSSRQD